MKTILRQIAHARSGDKGSSSNIAVFANDESIYQRLKEELTAEKVKSYFQTLGVKNVIRYDAPNLLALNFVLAEILAGGGSRSLRTDAQGKALGQCILEMEL